MRLLIDIRHSVRQLVRAPGFTLPVIGILALGIGISTAIVSAVDHVLFRPIALPESERLVTLCEVHQGDRAYCSVSPASVLEWRSRARTLDAGGVARARGIELHLGDRRVQASAAMATPEFLEALGARPLHGRLLQEGDQPPLGTGSVVVLSYELWQEQFGGDAGIIGRAVSVSSGGDGRVLDREPVTVVGVLPPGSRAPRLEQARAWIPLQFDPSSGQYRDWRGFVGIARLAAATTASEAAVELNAIEAQLAETYPEAMTGWTVDVHGLRGWLVRDVRPLLLLFLGAVGLVMTIVTVNVVSLLLARAARREREVSILAALGAGRARIVQQLLVEGVLLAAAGGAGGVILGTWLVQVLVAVAPAGVPRIEEVAVDGRVLVLSVALTTCMALVFGVVPALRLRQAHLQDVLKHGRTSTTDRQGRKVRRWLVVAELALALALLLSASLLLRSFTNLARYDPGFPIERLLTFQVYPPMWRYDSPARLRQFYADAERETSAIPGVLAVGTASAGPLIGGGDGLTPFVVPGESAPAPGSEPTVAWFDAGPGYFPALGVEVVAGRNLSAQADGELREALVNETMARRHWPEGGAVGARLSLPDWETEVEVVGVVADLTPFGQSAPVDPAIFVSNIQRPRGASFFVVRTAADPAGAVGAVERALARVDADVQPKAVATMEELLGERLVGPRFSMLLLSIFAALALLLSAAGVYALVAFTVATRTREFGIRMALGARSAQVMRSVLLDSGRLIAAGLLAGGLCALVFTRLLRGVIHDLAPADAAAAILAVVVLAIAGFGAAAVPAWRAARTEPTTALRSE